MKSVLRLSCVLVGLSSFSVVTAQDIYPDFALVVHLPSYEAFLRNLGSSPIRVDGYAIASASGSLNVASSAPLDSAGPEIVAALGPGADAFVKANPSPTSLAELNPLSSATWQPGQSWSIGFPFKSADPGFVLDAVFRFSSPDGLVLPGGLEVAPGDLFPAALVVIPEPSSGTLSLLAAVGFLGLAVSTRMRSV